MKICLPTMGKAGLKESVHNHFGSAKFFTIYDTETKQVQIIDNGNEHHAHGACQPLQAIAGHDIDAILTAGMGRRAVDLINRGGIKVYLLEGDTAEEAVQRFMDGKLTELTPANACGGHGDGHECH